MAELRCDQISASYGQDDVLSGVDLVVPDGTVTAILGSSGSGKTTLLRVIMGFIAQQSGTVSVGGPGRWRRRTASTFRRRSARSATSRRRARCTRT